ncbi:hypothetical protein NXX47_16540 [Bacteroides fragilis]|nr:hypothetical protein [Bacteroides fragilis]
MGDHYGIYRGPGRARRTIHNLPAFHRKILQAGHREQEKKWISSDFFPWDKGTPGVEYLEITGKDECVPMAFKTGLLTPGYLAGAVNINTTLRGAAKEQGGEEADTPGFLLCHGENQSDYRDRGPCGGVLFRQLTLPGAQRRILSGTRGEYLQVFTGFQGRGRGV